MKDTKLMIAVIGCFAIAVLFILVIVWEIKKSIDYGQKVRRLSALDKLQRKPKTASFLPSVAAKRLEVRISTDRESHDPPR